MLVLTDSVGAGRWANSPGPQSRGEAEGDDAPAALALIAARDGATPVDVTATGGAGEALTVLRKGRQLYALRAVPLRGDRRAGRPA